MSPTPPDNLNEIGVLERTRTAMEGASHCDFRFELRRPARDSQAETT